MLSVIIPNTDEPTVIQLTYENLRKELMAIDGSEILVTDRWETGIQRARGDFICFVEPDCLVSSGYFASNLNLFKKNAYYRKLAMLSSAVGIDNWGNKIYNYRIDVVERGPRKRSKSYLRIAPDRIRKGNGTYPVQIGFAPGAIFRKTALQEALEYVDFTNRDLVALSTDLAFYLWKTNRRVNVNPNAMYVSTDRKLENPSRWSPKVPKKVAVIFDQEQL